MRTSPVAALGFLIWLTLVPAVIFYGIAFGMLRYTNTGLLVYRAEAAKTMLHCTYFTGTHVLERRFSHDDLSYDQSGLVREGSCPWLIDVS